jgi:hypothetical protein
MVLQLQNYHQRTATITFKRTSKFSVHVIATGLQVDVPWGYTTDDNRRLSKKTKGGQMTKTIPIKTILKASLMKCKQLRRCPWSSYIARAVLKDNCSWHSSRARVHFLLTMRGKGLRVNMRERTHLRGGVVAPNSNPGDIGEEDFCLVRKLELGAVLVQAR